MRYYYQKLSQLHIEDLISKLVVFNKTNLEPFFFRNEDGRAMCICHGVKNIRNARFIFGLSSSEIRRNFIKKGYITDNETLYFISCFSSGILLDDSKCKFEYLTRYPVAFNVDDGYEFVITIFESEKDLNEILAMPAYKGIPKEEFKID